MDRRGFLKGIGALLATSALVKVPAAGTVAWDTTPFVAAGGIPPMADGTFTIVSSPVQWADLAREMNDLLYGDGIKPTLNTIARVPLLDGYIGAFHGFEIIETVPLTPREYISTMLGEPWFDGPK